MTYRLQASNGELLDALFEIEGRDVVFRARGGSISSGKGNNTEYGPALRLLFQRLSLAGIQVDRAFVDSAAVKSLAFVERQVLGPEDGELTPEEQFTVVSSRMRTVRAAGSVDRKGGNSTKRLRIRLQTDILDASLARLLGGRPTMQGSDRPSTTVS